MGSGGGPGQTLGPRGKTLLFGAEEKGPSAAPQHGGPRPPFLGWGPQPPPKAGKTPRPPPARPRGKKKKAPIPVGGKRRPRGKNRLGKQTEILPDGEPRGGRKRAPGESWGGNRGGGEPGEKNGRGGWVEGRGKGERGGLVVFKAAEERGEKKTPGVLISLKPRGSEIPVGQISGEKKNRGRNHEGGAPSLWVWGKRGKRGFGV